ncbi:phosphatidylglycerophosphatase A [bacterium]|nr:phosphatidylglycerophosphatase A [bacterium]
MQKKIEILYLSFFGVGLLPVAPGTWGSLATIPFLYLMNIWRVPPVLLAPFFIFVLFGTCYVTDSFQRKYKTHDPGWIVIDEVLGMFTAYFFVGHFFKTSTIIYLFILFRLFDIYKIYPATYFDRMTHGAGTILDDIVSGIYTGLVLLFLYSQFPEIFF